MTLRAPKLDDRTFQQLVDDAKRLVQERCPQWSDHNVSDPGVTLIEAYAQMVDQLIYRLNRVPDRNYVKFLELIGVELRPPAAALGEVTFWLSAPQPHNVVVRAETEVATPRTDIDAPVVFTTTAPLQIVSCQFAAAGAAMVNGDPVDATIALSDQGFTCFSEIPIPGDALLVGLTAAVPSCAVVLRLDCRVAGVGVDPRDAPIVWEAWNGSGWSACEVDRDETGGLNRPGDVVLHVPPTHQASIMLRQRAGWLRCRMTEARSDQPTYRESPRVHAVTAFTIGGTVGMVNAEAVREEVLGTSDGSPGQQFPLQRRPVVLWHEPSVLQVSTESGWRDWAQVSHFASSGPNDEVFRIDAFGGELQLGPAVRLADGTLREYGSRPPKGAVLRLSAYRTGGGRRGNVSRGAVRVLKTSTPYVSRVENRAPAVGGAEAEELADAKIRGPVMLRSRGRAVTAEDFEELAHEIAPDAARVKCIPTDGTGERDGVRLIVIPHVAGDEVGRIRVEDLDPPMETLARISGYLDERRLVGTRLVVQPPQYRWLTAVVSVTARRGFRPEDVQRDVLAAIYGLLHPLTGGPDRTGWPFGRSVQSHEIAAVLARLPGVDMSHELSVQLFPADAVTRRRGTPVERLDLDPTELVYSFEHQVRVSE
jgi:predicted phage baseplate assembly protein